MPVHSSAVSQKEDLESNYGELGVPESDDRHMNILNLVLWKHLKKMIGNK